MGGCDRQKEASADGVVTLDFLNYATPEFMALYNRKLIPAFHATHPKIRVRTIESLGDAGYDAKLLTLIAGKMAPDIFHVVQTNFPSYAARDVLLPVDELLADDPDLSRGDFYPQILDGMTWDGRLLGLPTDFSTILMFYNQDLFDRFKVERPVRGWRWDDYLDAATKLTHDLDGDGFTDVYGTCNPNQYNRWPAWVWMNGGDLFTPDMTRCTMDSPEAIGGLQFYADLSLKHRVAPTPGQSMGQQYQALFASQMVGMAPDSRHIYKTYLRREGLPFTWDVAPMPTGRWQATTFIWGGNCILRSTKHPREAWELVKFLSGPEAAKIAIEAGNALPAYVKGAEEAVAHPMDRNTPAGDQFFLDAVEYGRVAPSPPQNAEYLFAMGRLQDAFLGLTSVEQACREFTDEVNGFLTGGVF